MAKDIFERPDLKRNNRTLEFSAKLRLGPDLDNLIKETGTPVGQFYLFAESYTTSRAKHALAIRCAFSRTFSPELGESVQQTEITFNFGLTPGLKPQADVANPKHILQPLNKIQTEVHTFSCSITYDYKSQEKKRFVLALPIRLTQSPIFPFHTIDGISILGETQDIHYSALVGAYPSVKTTHVLILFRKDYHFDNHIAHNILNDADAIVNTLMTPTGG
jgi:hypothetical protein